MTSFTSSTTLYYGTASAGVKIKTHKLYWYWIPIITVDIRIPDNNTMLRCTVFIIIFWTQGSGLMPIDMVKTILATANAFVRRLRLHWGWEKEDNVFDGDLFWWLMWHSHFWNRPWALYLNKDIFRSLLQCNSSYINCYLFHWPRRNGRLSWTALWCSLFWVALQMDWPGWSLTAVWWQGC